MLKMRVRVSLPWWVRTVDVVDEGQELAEDQRPVDVESRREWVSGLTVWQRRISQSDVTTWPKMTTKLNQHPSDSLSTEMENYRLSKGSMYCWTVVVGCNIFLVFCPVFVLHIDTLISSTTVGWLIDDSLLLFCCCIIGKLICCWFWTAGRTKQTI